MSNRLRHRRWTIAAAVLGLAGTSCGVALVGAGVGVVGVGAAVLAYSCDEPVDVTVWTSGASHPVCDARVVAESNGKRVEFSPCYRAYLGVGAWNITAACAGSSATGSLVIDPNHRCNEPGFHTVELTLPADGPRVARSGGPAPRL